MGTFSKFNEGLLQNNLNAIPDHVAGFGYFHKSFLKKSRVCQIGSSLYSIKIKGNEWCFDLA